MNAAMNRFASPIVGALVALAVGLSPAAARQPRDDVYRSPRLEAHRITRVALLPVVGTAHDAIVEKIVEASWVTLYGEGTTTWMPADEVRARLANDATGLLREADEQIWRAGNVEPALASRLARELGVDGVLALRIDRWEIADGGRATVELSAALTHADGTVLWSIRGLQGYGSPARSAEQSFKQDMSWVRRAYLEPQDQPRRLNRALRGLLARWAWSLPAPLYARNVQGDGGPDLALNSGD